MIRRLLAASVTLLVAAAPALAQSEAACDETVEIDRYRYLRQVTLDLFGRVPTRAELEALKDADGIESVDVEAMLNDEEFTRFVRRHHRDLLWPSTDPGELVTGFASILLPSGFYELNGDPNRLFSIYTGLYQRNGLFVPCKDEPAEWDEDGDLIFEDMPDGTRREGYVMVEPYWAPGTEVKVCALEARIEPVAANGTPCDNIQGLFSGDCGCGPELLRCMDFPGIQRVTQSLEEQLLRMVEAPIYEGRPYTEMLMGQGELVNGPLVHYYRYQAPMAVDPIIQVPPVDVSALEDITFNDDDWYEVPRSTELHSGILTSMSFLLRFQTSRARANRFHTAFLCDPFVAPDTPLPSADAECSNEPNLRERCGCNYCHGRLEPASAWWGRFADAGTMFLDPETYPTYMARCADCAREGRQCDFICDRFYVSEIGHEKQEPYAGVLKSYEWRDQSEVAKVEAGPRGFVEEAIADGRLAACTTEKLFVRLYKREPTAEERLRLLPEFAEVFVDSNYDFKALVKALITDEAYRRMVR